MHGRSRGLCCPHLVLSWKAFLTPQCCVGQPRVHGPLLNKLGFQVLGLHTWRLSQDMSSVLCKQEVTKGLISSESQQLPKVQM